MVNIWVGHGPPGPPGESGLGDIQQLTKLKYYMELLVVLIIGSKPGLLAAPSVLC